MFNLFKKSSATPTPVPMQLAMRDFLFGDLPIELWPGERSNVEDVEPWRSFVAARTCLKEGNAAEAEAKLRGVLAMPDLESRHYLQAWQFLREQGVQPSGDEAKHLYGVVVEVGLEQGLDIVAAYGDHTARYYNYGGGAVIWEHPDTSLDEAIDALLAAGKSVVDRIGPWEGVHPAAPTTGMVRVNMLVPGGLHFGQGPFETLYQDPMGGPVIAAANRLMERLIDVSMKESG
jgi:hypothetical protein